MEKKKKFRNYPDPIGHMVLWGLGSGLSVATVVIFWLAPNDLSFYGSILVQVLLTFIYGILLGGISGIFLGMLSGWVLSQVLKEALVPFTWEELRSYRIKAYTFVTLLCAIGALAPILLMLFLVGFLPELLLMPLIAVPLSVLATWHYFSRLRHWSIAISQKEKNMYFEYLEDELELEEEEGKGDKEKTIQRIS